MQSTGGKNGVAFRWHIDRSKHDDALSPSLIGPLLQISREKDLCEIVAKTLMPLVTSDDVVVAVAVSPSTATTTATATATDTPDADADAGDDSELRREPGDVRIPLRTIYWFVTNYAKKYGVSITVNKQVVNIYNSYRDWINRWKRSLFDVYRRGTSRVYFDWPTGDGEDHRECWTTVAQLNFALWAHRHHVLNYVRNNLAAIQADRDQNNNSKKRRRRDGGNAVATADADADDDEAAPPSDTAEDNAGAEAKRKRRTLSQAPIQTCTVLPITEQRCLAFSGFNDFQFQ